MFITLAQESTNLKTWTDKAWHYAETYGPKIILALVLLIVAMIVSSWIGALVRGTCTKAKMEITLARFFGKITRWAVLIMAVLSILSYFGIQTTSFAAVIGAATLAIGLSMQGSLGNFASGVMLLIFRPFKVGDVVNVAGETGKVFEIDLLNTTMDTPDNRRIVVPNGAVFGSTIQNITFHGTRRVDVAVGTEYSADLDKTREVLESVFSGIEGGLTDPEPVVYLLELGSSSINWSLRMWANTADYWAVRERMTRAAKVALDNAGIGIPFPQMDVHLDKNA